jgi:hypothetical protein
MTFLPDNYKVPKSEGGNHLKLQDGRNSVRILSDVITGYLYWSDDNKPQRLRDRPEGTPSNIRIEDGKPDRIRHFWACVAWEGGSLKVWEITQASIQDAIAALAEDPQWGHPRGYQLAITRSGKGLNTEYSVVPAPPSPVPDEVLAAWKSRDIDLEELYRSGNPFSPSNPPLGAAGSFTESRALRLFTDGLGRSQTAEQVEKWNTWASKEPQLGGIARYAGDEAKAKDLIAALVGDRVAAFSVAVGVDSDIPF